MSWRWLPLAGATIACSETGLLGRLDQGIVGGPRAAHLVLGPVSGVIEAADADTTVRGVTGDRLGLEVGRGGDLDADGYDDALVGAPMAASNTGTVWLLYGNAL